MKEESLTRIDSSLGCLIIISKAIIVVIIIINVVGKAQVP